MGGLAREGPEALAVSDDSDFRGPSKGWGECVWGPWGRAFVGRPFLPGLAMLLEGVGGCKAANEVRDIRGRCFLARLGSGEGRALKVGRGIKVKPSEAMMDSSCRRGTVWVMMGEGEAAGAAVGARVRPSGQRLLKNRVPGEGEERRRPEARKWGEGGEEEKEDGGGGDGSGGGVVGERL